MTIDKWEYLMHNDHHRTEWLKFYKESDPIFAAIMDFAKTKPDRHKAIWELAIIELLDQKTRKIADEDWQDHHA